MLRSRIYLIYYIENMVLALLESMFDVLQLLLIEGSLGRGTVGISQRITNLCVIVPHEARR